jgi:hypothetical protein
MQCNTTDGNAVDAAFHLGEDVADDEILVDAQLYKCLKEQSPGLCEGALVFEQLRDDDDNGDEVDAVAIALTVDTPHTSQHLETWQINTSTSASTTTTTATTEPIELHYSQIDDSEIDSRLLVGTPPVSPKSTTTTTMTTTTAADMTATTMALALTKTSVEADTDADVDVDVDVDPVAAAIATKLTSAKHESVKAKAIAPAAAAAEATHASGGRMEHFQFSSNSNSEQNSRRSKKGTYQTLSGGGTHSNGSSVGDGDLFDTQVRNCLLIRVLFVSFFDSFFVVSFFKFDGSGGVVLVVTATF